MAKPSIEDARGFVRKVKEHFSNEMSVYQQFITTLKQYRSAIITRDEAIKSVETTFNGHPELVEGFRMFYDIVPANASPKISKKRTKESVTIVEEPVAKKPKTIETAIEQPAHDPECAKYQEQISKLIKENKNLRGEELESLTMEELNDLELSQEKSLKRTKDRKNELLRRQMELHKTDNTCVICLDRPKNVAIVDCGHYSLCDQCTNNVTQCPLCKVSITKTLRIFS